MNETPPYLGVDPITRQSMQSGYSLLMAVITGATRCEALVGEGVNGKRERLLIK
jgi:hypothetical protein